MGANDYILAVYAVSGALALGCAFLPGAGPVGRVFNLITGIGFLGWTANIYLRNGWYTTSPILYALPVSLMIYAIVTLLRLCFQPGDAADGRDLAIPRQPERRGPRRETLPGEFSAVPINEAPPIHDPWQALYAAERRDALRDAGVPPEGDDVRDGNAGNAGDDLREAGALRDGGGRHRQVVPTRQFDAVAAIAAYSSRHMEYEAMKSTFETAEAEFEAWQARSSEPGSLGYPGAE